jgi:hypothetical protein
MWNREWFTIGLAFFALMATALPPWGQGLAPLAEAARCTAVPEPCGVYMTMFGKCCLNAGGFQTGRPPVGYETLGAIPVADPPQCGAEFTFLPPFFPCGWSTGAFCGGTSHSTDCE